MSLIETNTFTIAKKQYIYKIKSYTNLFYGITVVQIIALLFSVGGWVSTTMCSDNLDVSMRTYSSVVIIAFTMMWIFIVSILIGTKSNISIDFTFITNRMSSNISDIAFLLTAAFVGGITVTVNNFILRIIIYFSIGGKNILSENFFVTPKYIIIGIISVTLYLIVLSALGYFCGIIFSINKIAIIVLPALIIGQIMVEIRNGGQPTMLIKIIGFFSNETSLIVFIVKIGMTAMLLFAAGIVASNRMEVRK